MVWEDPRIIDKAGHLIYPDGQNRGRGTGQLDRGQYDQEEEILWPDGCAALYAREMVDEIGGFDEDLSAYGDDADLGLRARIAGWKCIYVPSAVVRHHRGSTLGVLAPKRIKLIERNRVLLAAGTVPWVPVVAEHPLLPGQADRWSVGGVARQGRDWALPVPPRQAARRLVDAPGGLGGHHHASGDDSQTAPNQPKAEADVSSSTPTHHATPDFPESPERQAAPPGGVALLTGCPMCGAAGVNTLLKGTDRLFGTTDKTFLVVQCIECHLMRLNPTPAPRNWRPTTPATIGLLLANPLETDWPNCGAASFSATSALLLVVPSRALRPKEPSSMSDAVVDCFSKCSGCRATGFSAL